jgi:hypothetical protein
MPMKMRKLMATKPHKYGTRHLTAGEEYEVPVRHAIALVAGRKANFVPDKPVRAAKVEQKFVSDSDDSIVDSIGGAATTEAAIDSLRVEATQLGIDVDGRWGVARLQHEIAQAKS